MKNYLTKDTMIQTLKLLGKGYYQFVIKPFLFYLQVTFYGNTRPSYLSTANLLELKKQTKLLMERDKETKNTIPNFRNFAQEVSTEDYYNTLQELRGNNS